MQRREREKRRGGGVGEEVNRGRKERGRRASGDER